MTAGRENAGMNRVPFEYNEAYPHIVLQAFLQRVINGVDEGWLVVFDCRSPWRHRSGSRAGAASTSARTGSP